MQDIRQKSVQDTVVEAMLNVWVQANERHSIPITGCSMLPLIRDGDSVLITHGCAGVRRGDVVVFRCSGKLVAHRVIRREVDKGSNGVAFVTKGDNVFQFDPPVQGSEVIGRVLGIRKGEREILLDTAAWRILGLGIVVGTLTIAMTYSWLRDFTGKMPGFRSKHARDTLNRIRQAFFLYMRKMVFFTFCGLR